MSPRLPLAFAASLLLALLPASAQAQANAAGYRLPPPALQALVDAPRPPQLLLSPARDLAAMVQTPALPSIATVAQPELKLAGLRINPRTYSQSRFSFGTDAWLVTLSTQQAIRLSGLPKSLNLADAAWSPDQRYLAATNVDATAGVVELWLIDVAARRANKLSSAPLNTVMSRGFSWMPDSRRLLVTQRASDGGAAPVSDGIPTGPNAQDSTPAAGQRQIRTYPDLLKNDADARLFAHYATSQLALIDLQGKTTRLGAPAMYQGVSPSPDGRYLLASRLGRPFSYLVPASSFPRRIEVLDLSGKSLHTVADLPLVEGLPNGNDSVRLGVRDIEWRADAPATLVWAEAQDGGDATRPADIRDHVLMQAAPFQAPPVVLARLATRYSDITWGRGDLALLTEYWWKTRAFTQWRIAPDQPTAAPEKIVSGSSEDRYADPGNAVTVRDAAGYSRLLIASDGQSIFLDGDGASAEGDRPFIDKFNLVTKEKTRLFRSEAPNYESIAAILDGDGQRLLTSRESANEPPNYFIRELGANARLIALTNFPHPTPQLKGIQKEQIRYKRADGVDLTATLYLPPGYEPKRDGPLPMLMWAYPTEFKSASAASQVTDSPYRFNAVGYWGPQAFLAMGYAVLDDPSMPIVGEGDKESNDTYLPQLVASAEAAVNEVVRRGVADRDRIAIGGHSYGAFMTGNLLAHTRLFKAGIARSGAYNRTLTPFGFQSEERNFWQAKDVYQQMSPFNYAENIKDALLLIHGEQDNNPGTFPIQSERMFAAIKGLGGTARLVMLPNESHGYRARESILQMLAESNDWLEKYVKNAER